MGWFPEQPGGLDRYYMDLMAALPAAGVAATGLVLGSAAVERETGGRIQAVAPADAPLLARWRAMRRAFAVAPRPDVVAAHFALYAFPLLRRLAAFPFVVHFHGPWAQEGRREGGGGYWAKALLERTVYRRADRCVCLSRAFARELTEGFGVPEQRVRIVPGGVDIGRFASGASRADARATLGWPTDRPIVFCVRRLVRRMGLESLIDAAAVVRRSVPEVLVLIAGRGPLEADLRQRIGDRGVGDHVRLLGFAADDLLPSMYRAADMCVVPTESLEGFGLTATESLAAGTPVLVTPVGGLPEVVGDLSSGLVLSAVGTHAVADGLTAALTGRLPLPTAAACAAYAAGRFDWSVVARQVCDVYREAMAGRA